MADPTIPSKPKTATLAEAIQEIVNGQASVPEGVETTPPEDPEQEEGEAETGEEQSIPYRRFAKEVSRRKSMETDYEKLRSEYLVSERARKKLEFDSAWARQLAEFDAGKGVPDGWDKMSNISQVEWLVTKKAALFDQHKVEEPMSDTQKTSAKERNGEGKASKKLSDDVRSILSNLVSEEEGEEVARLVEQHGHTIEEALELAELKSSRRSAEKGTMPTSHQANVPRSTRAYRNPAKAPDPYEKVRAMPEDTERQRSAKWHAMRKMKQSDGSAYFFPKQG